MNTHARIRIKFCGITRVEDALEAARLGADAIGLVFVPRSPRCLSVDAAAEIARAVPPFVSRVALFADAEPDVVLAVVAAIRPDQLQFHGSETPVYCRQFGTSYIKAIAMAGQGDATAFIARYPDASAFLLDSHAQGGQGGTGLVFDWSRVPRGLARPLILAGGLTPSNVGAAVRSVHPFAVDVSSGIESTPGVKDHAKMRDFVEEVRRAGG